MTKWEMLHPRMTMAHLGHIPDFLFETDPRPAREQFNEHYKHGGGWRPHDGFKLLSDNSLESKYPEDPPLKPLAQTRLRDELICYYQHSWMAIIQPDRQYEVSRVD